MATTNSLSVLAFGRRNRFKHRQSHNAHNRKINKAEIPAALNCFFNIRNSMSYFKETSPKNWSFADAFQHYQNRNPNETERVILRNIKMELGALEEHGGKLGDAAVNCLKNWSKLVKKLPLQEKKKSSAAEGLSDRITKIGKFEVKGDVQNISINR